jgi:hypothetical protein
MCVENGTKKGKPKDKVKEKEEQEQVIRDHLLLR